MSTSNLFTGFGKPPENKDTTNNTNAKPAPSFGGFNLGGPGASGAFASSASNPLFGGFGKPAGTSTGPNIFTSKPDEPSTATTTPSTTTNPFFGGLSGSENKTAPPPLFSGFSSTPKPTETSKSPFSLGNPASTNTSIPAAPSFNLFGKSSGTPASTTEPPVSGGPSTPSGDPSKASSTATTVGSDLFKAPVASTGGKEGSSSTIPNFFANFGSSSTNKDAPPKSAEKEKDGSSTSADKPIVAAANPLFSAFGQTAQKSGEAPAPPTAASGTTTTPAPAKDTSTTGTSTGAAPAATPAPATSIPTSVPQPSLLRGKSIEEIVNKWDSDLQTNVQEFTRVANEVSAWDKVLIENGNYISQLHNQVLAAEASQQLIEQTLLNVESQQQELSTVLEVYEKQAKSLLDGTAGGLRAFDTGPADAERDRNYTMATELSTHLDDLTKSLSQLIESVNELSLSSGAEASEKADPLTQIAEVLNEHLASLNWIDGTLGEMEGKVKEIAPRLFDKEGGQNGNSKRGPPGYRVR